MLKDEISEIDMKQLIYEKLNNIQINDALYSLIINNNIPNTSNNNGIFINISLCTRKILIIFYDFIKNIKIDTNNIIENTDVNINNNFYKEQKDDKKNKYNKKKKENDKKNKPIQKIKLTPLQQKIISYSL